MPPHCIHSCTSVVEWHILNIFFSINLCYLIFSVLSFAKHSHSSKLMSYHFFLANPFQFLIPCSSQNISFTSLIDFSYPYSLFRLSHCFPGPHKCWPINSHSKLALIPRLSFLLFFFSIIYKTLLMCGFLELMIMYILMTYSILFIYDLLFSSVLNLLSCADIFLTFLYYILETNSFENRFYF